jgi:hypothetical protein
MTTRKDPYEVGYGKPPMEHRWRKGTSGNPRGRPRKAQAALAQHSFDPFREQFLAEMLRPISIKEAGRTVELPAIQAISRSLVLNALKGNSKAQQLALNYYKSAQAEQLDDMAGMLRAIELYKTEWPARALQAEREGKPLPLPRPQHIGLSLARGVMETNGPTDQHQDELWQTIKFKLRCLEAHLREAEEDAARDPTNCTIRDRAAKCKLNISKLERSVPPGWDWRECVTEEDRKHYLQLGMVPKRRET